MKLSSILAMIGLALSLALSLPGQTVRVLFVAGQASLHRPDEPAPRAAVKGDTVIIGTRIVTGADGRVVLTPMPGVNSIIAPNTTIVLESASETRTSASNVTHAATLDLKQGAVTTDLDKPEGVTYDYNIRTVRGLAGARGTTFTVGINAAGIQTIVVAHGTIIVNFADGRQGTLAAGKLSITKPTGQTQSVANVNELPPEDQPIAQNWIETTISALATALEAGIELDPSALQNALDAAKTLGITLSPETQTLVDRVLTDLMLINFVPPPRVTNEITQAAIEVVTEQVDPLVYKDIPDFRASLPSEAQRIAFDEILLVGGFEENLQTAALVLTETDFPTSSPASIARKELETKLQREAQFGRDLRAFVDFYAGLLQSNGDTDNRYYYPAPELYVLTNLGILGNGNLAVFGADLEGLELLLKAYYLIDAPSPNFAYEGDYAADRPEHSTIVSSNVFFPGTYNNSGKTIYNVTFETEGGSTLRVGATRQLKIDNTGHDGDTFIAGYSTGEPAYSYGRVELRAIDLVDLNHTRFGPNVTDIMVAANTINLRNITFREGTTVSLHSKLGLPNFGSSKFGHVNFITNVKYGTTLISAETLPTLGNIYIGTIGQSLNID